MFASVLEHIDASVIGLVLFVLMLLTIVWGNKMRKRFWELEDGDTKGGVNSLLGALFALWGFILAFTFGQSGTRFENLKGVIVDEANIMRTVIIKADLFPDSIRNAYRADLQKYLEERIIYYDYATDETRFNRNREEISATAKSLWARTAALSKKPETKDAAFNMVLTLTTLFDIGIKRETLLTAGIPGPIKYMLIALVLAICFVGGFTTPAIDRKEWIVITVFALLATSILYLTIDLARPMDGLIKPDTGQAAILNLRKLF
jgi:hypothetical protein